MVVVVYDITVRESLTDGVTNWHKQLQENCSTEDLLLVLVGNKTDLESSRTVDESEGREVAEKMGAIYCETSAKTGFNVDKLFMDICLKLEERNNNNLPNSDKIHRGRGLTVKSHNNQIVQPKKTSSHCCKSE